VAEKGRIKPPEKSKPKVLEFEVTSKNPTYSLEYRLW